MSISYVTASGKDIAEIVDKIEAAVGNYPSYQVSIACVVVAAMAQKPDITPKQLQDVVKGATEYLATVLFNESESESVN